jgi:cellulose synthase (UDP-forming)
MPDGTARAVRPSSPSLWHHQRAPGVRLRDRSIVAVLTAAGIVAVLRLFDWWFRPEHVAHPLLFGLLSIAFWYGISRSVLGWVNALAIARPAHCPAPPGRRVAIFTTSAPGEPLGMLEATLAACARIR